MSKVGERSLDDVQMHQLIAAILTVASAGAETFLPKSIVTRYHEIRKELRLNPEACKDAGDN